MYFCILVGIFLTNLKKINNIDKFFQVCKKNTKYHRKSLENYYNYLNINATINICESNK